MEQHLLARPCLCLCHQVATIPSHQTPGVLTNLVVVGSPSQTRCKLPDMQHT